MIQEQGDLDDSYHQDAQNDEDQMIISGDSIDRYLKSDLNNEEVNSGTGAVPKMSNLIGMRLNRKPIKPWACFQIYCVVSVFAWCLVCGSPIDTYVLFLRQGLGNVHDN